MDYEHVKKQLGYGIQTESKDNAIKALEQLQAKVAELEGQYELAANIANTSMDRVRELEEENARLKAESRDACLGLNDYYGRKLAAEQLNNKLLREALEFLDSRIVTMDLGGVVERALSLPASTEALDAYVAEKVKEAGKFDGWKTNPYTKVLETSIEQLTKQRDLAVEALKWLKLIFTDSEMSQERNPELWMPTVEEAIKESEAK